MPATVLLGAEGVFSFISKGRPTGHRLAVRFNDKQHKDMRNCITGCGIAFCTNGSTVFINRKEGAAKTAALLEAFNFSSNRRLVDAKGLGGFGLRSVLFQGLV
jgi:hypothetical protein